MKSLVDLSVDILQDCGMQCGANPFRDCITITRRIENEGISFLTITLPSFCRDFERSLDEGFIPPAHFRSFRRKKGTCLPAFLQGFMGMVFNPDGSLLNDPSSSAIKAIRQICLFAKKILLPCTTSREKKAEEAFVKCESDLHSVTYDPVLLDVYSRVSKIVMNDLLVDFEEFYREIVPRHGPGITTDAGIGNKKFLFPTWYSRVEKYFPFTEFGIASISNYVDGLSSHPVVFVEPRDEPPVKVVFVPKTMKTPRVIAIETCGMQYMQQAFANWIRTRIERPGSLLFGHVNFRDQSINSKLALSSSRSQRYATIDMSEASDRVSSRLVHVAFEHFPEFRKMIFALRSTRAKLPSGGVIHLKKFASMGSALCFPVESLVFMLTLVSARLHIAGRRPSKSAIRKVIADLHVYGDDLIVPVDEAPSLCKYLESFGLKVNADKSFWTGKFRESCGTDAYDGEPVTPVYLRYDIPTKRTETQKIVSFIETLNQLYEAGLWGTVKKWRSHVESLIGKLPTLPNDHPGVGWRSFSQALSFNGWSDSLQRLKLRCLVAQPARHKDHLTGDPALLKCLAMIGNPNRPTDHLEFSVRRGSLTLKSRWI